MKPQEVLSGDRGALSDWLDEFLQRRCFGTADTLTQLLHLAQVRAQLLQRENRTEENVNMHGLPTSSDLQSGPEVFGQQHNFITSPPYTITMDLK